MFLITFGTFISVSPAIQRPFLGPKAFPFVQGKDLFGQIFELCLIFRGIVVETALLYEIPGRPAVIYKIY